MLFAVYINKLEKDLDDIDGNSPCLFVTVVIVILYVDNIILLSKSRTKLQRLLKELHEFCTSSRLKVNLCKTKIMNFGCNKRKLNQKAFYLDNDQIEITHKHKYVGIGFYSHGYFGPSSKWRSMKALMATLRKIAIVKITCRKLKSHLFKAFGASNFHIWL